MRIGIIGGGASGLASAVFLARAGHKVTIFERKDRVGKKLLATGNGRCNLGNKDLGFKHFHSVKGPWPKKILEDFTGEMARDFFDSIGIDLVEEARGKLYPISLQANSVLNALRDELERLGVEEMVEKKIDRLTPHKGGFILSTNGQDFIFDRVILATGGKTMPKSGSDGTSYKLVTDWGHTLTDTFPAICGIQLNSPYLRHLAGTKIQGEIHLVEGKKVLFSSQGEILFAKDGISGPPVLDLARCVHVATREKTVFFPLINHLDQLGKDYREKLESRSYLPWTLESFLQGIVSKKWIHVLSKDLGLSQETLMSDMSFEQRTRLLDMLFSYSMEVVGTRDFESAQVTCGGLSLRDFNLESLESKILPGLYAVGEVLDIDGDCGGYNLHWAWASSWTVSRAID